MKRRLLVLLPLLLGAALVGGVWRGLAGAPPVAVAAPRTDYSVADSDTCGSGVTFQWVDATGGTRWDLDAGDLDLPDYVSVTLPLSQSFTFYGEAYDHVWFNDFATVLFGDDNLYDDDAPSGIPPIPNATPLDPNGAIYAAWGNIYLHTFDDPDAAVYTLHETSQGRNWFVIEYYKYENLLGAADTFEVILDLDTGDVRVQYLAMSSALFAVAGIEDQTGSAGILYVDTGVPAENALHDGLAVWYGVGEMPAAAGVSITPEAEGVGEPGQAVTYTLTVTNTGTEADSFGLQAGGASWPTTLWDATFTNPLTETAALAPCESADVGVMVTLPPNPVVSTDVAFVWAASRLDAGIIATATISTRNSGPGVNVSPAQTGGGLPGSVITYSVAVTNTGGVADQYALSLSGFSWPTAFAPPMTQTLPLVAGAAQTVLVTVTVPANTPVGVADEAVLLVSSWQNDGAEIATTLRSVALAAPAALLSPAQTGLGTPKDVVTYTVWLTNTSTSIYDYNVSLTGAAWEVGLMPALDHTGPLTTGQSLSLTVVVSVPREAVAGTQDTAVLALSTPVDPAFGPTTTVTTVAAADPSFDIVAVGGGAGRPGGAVTYTVGLENDGNITDTYALFLSGNTWPTQFSPPMTETEPLAPGGVLFFQVVVSVPLGTAAGVTDTALLEVASLGFNTLFTTTALTSQAATAPAIWLPASLSGGTVPGGMVSYVITVTNAGNISDSYTMTLATYGWFTQFAPPYAGEMAILADMAVGESRALVVTVVLSPLAEMGAADTVILRATSATDPAIFAVTLIMTEATQGSHQLYLPVFARR